MHSLFIQIGALQLLGGLVLFLRTKLPLTIPEPSNEFQRIEVISPATWLLLQSAAKRFCCGMRRLSGSWPDKTDHLGNSSLRGLKNE
jgi:hypothetical protein